MSNNNTRNTMMLIAGGYLVYLGYTLLKDVIIEELDNEILFVVCGIIFVLAGAYVVFSRGKDIIMFKYDTEETETSDEEIVDVVDTEEDNQSQDVKADIQETCIEENKEK